MAIGTPYSVCGGTGAAGAASTLQVNAGSGIGGALGVSQGSAIVVALLGNSALGLPNGCTDSQNNSYSQVLLDTARTPSLGFYVALNATPLVVANGDWIKGSYSGTNGGKALIARACAGVMGNPALDGTSVHDAGSGTTATSNATSGLKQASEWAIAAISNGTAGGTPSAWTGGFAAVNTQGAGPFLTLADQVVSSTAALTAGATLSLTTTWTCGVITLRAATPPPFPVIPVSAAALIRAASW